LTLASIEFEFALAESEEEMVNRLRGAKSLPNLIALGVVALALGILGSGRANSTDSTDVRWGAVGHDDKIADGTSSSYNTLPLNRQIMLLGSIGADWYRTACEDANCGTLIQLASASGVGILRSIELQPDATLSEASNYAHGYQYALTEATKYRNAFKFYEASNEADVWVGMSGDGSARAQYNQQRYVQARGLISGLIDGIRAGDPSAQILVDDAGWCHYGFLQALWADGLRWDITAFHWYASQGDMEHAGCGGTNVAAAHASFGLPVWITEFNSDIAAKADDESAAAVWISQFMTQVRTVASKYKIEGAFVYELIDEPSLPGAQAHFGIFDANGIAKAASSSITKFLSTPTQASPSPPTHLQVLK